jgi:ribonucleoside-triphosphate reductase
MANAQKVAYYAEQAGHGLPIQVMKRDGRLVDFDINRIENAVARCYASCENHQPITATEVAERVANAVAASTNDDEIPSVEKIQDTVELVLQSSGAYEAAKRYILYRAEHAKDRDNRQVPDDIRKIFDESAKYFPTELQQFMFFDKYSHYNYELGRRETWIETVDRATDFLAELSQYKLHPSVYGRINNAILNMRVMPSMRLLATGGEYARSQNLAIFNCSYLPGKDLEAFCEALLISMSGCGVGFSVESYYVDQLPRIRRQKKNSVPSLHIVEDTTDGWIEALRTGLNTWFNGDDVEFDFSKVRRAGRFSPDKANIFGLSMFMTCSAP